MAYQAMTSEFILHKGKRILLMKAEKEPEEILANIPKARKIIDSQPKQSLLIITDVSEAQWDTRVIGALKEFTAKNTPYVRASAVVGISGLKKVILQGVARVTGRNIRAFDNIAEAKDWLAGLL